MTDQKPLMNFDNVRDELQQENMRKIEAEGFCPFCPEHLKKYHEPPILKKSKHWTITPNMYPYENTAHQILFIVHRHLTDSKDLLPEEWAELQDMIRWCIEELDVDCGTFIMRSGDMTKTGGTVSHLHAQLIVGSDPKKPVITRVG